MSVFKPALSYWKRRFFFLQNYEFKSTAWRQWAFMTFIIVQQQYEYPCNLILTEVMSVVNLKKAPKNQIDV
jgi:hypothetical protein